MSAPTHRVVAIEVVEDRTATSRLDEGFLRLRRLRARNRRADGSASAMVRTTASPDAMSTSVTRSVSPLKSMAKSLQRRSR